MTDAAEVTLKPCPFCGSAMELIHDHTTEDIDRVRHVMPQIDCPINGASGFAVGNDQLVTAWNTRSTTAQQARIDELEALRHPIVSEIMAEVEKATRKFPTWPTRIIDAGTVVSEEAGELAKACLQVTYEKEKETLEGVRMEAIQTAAMCFRFLVSMDQYDTSPAEQHEQPALIQGAEQ